MAIALRRPQADELLGTLIVEYLADERVTRQYAYLTAVLDCQTSSFVMMPSGLQRLSEEAKEYWGLDAAEIARELTPMPYHVASASPRVASNVLSVMIQAPTRIRNRGGLGFGRYVDLQTLRFCRQCIGEDKAGGLRPYFRRVHQLPGVAVCPKHEAFLTCSQLGVSTLHVDGASRFFDAFRGGDDVEVGGVRETKMHHLVEVAKRSEMALTYVQPSGYFAIQQHYRAQLNELGFMYGNGNCRLEELSRAVVEHFGRPYLEWLGMYRTGQEARDWIVPLLCRGQAVAPTISHVLLQQFLLSRAHGGFRSDSFTIKCPSHAFEPDHEGISAMVSWKSESTGIGRCVCGASFGFHLDGDKAVVDRVWRHSHAYGQAAIELTRKGASVQDVAADLGVSAMTARRLVAAQSGNTAPGREHAGTSATQHHRDEWIQAVECAGSLRMARLTARCVYRWLLKYDREWLAERRRGMMRPVMLRVDWTRRDEVYLAALREATDVLRMETPPRWVSAISILMVSGVPRGTRNQLEKLPQCRAFLMTKAESREHYRSRLAAWRRSSERGLKSNCVQSLSSHRRNGIRGHRFQSSLAG